MSAQLDVFYQDRVETEENVELAKEIISHLNIAEVSKEELNIHMDENIKNIYELANRRRERGRARTKRKKKK